MERRFLNIENWSGGLSDSPLLGIKGSFAEGVGIDIHSQPGVLGVNQRLIKDSGSIITELCKNAVNASDESSYWFSSSSGKIWKRTKEGVWSLAHTNTKGACLGACEWEDYLYYATETSLGRFGPLSGTAEWSDEWNTGLTSASYHPMAVQGLYLIIGNGSDIATVDDVGTFTPIGTPDITFSSLPSNQKIRTIRKFGADVLIGTYSTNNSPAMLIRWDTVSPTFLGDPPDIPQTTIQTIISEGTYAYIIAGEFGQIYYYDGNIAIPYKQIPGNYASNKYLKVNPEAVCDFRGKTTFGVSNGSGDSTLQGVYSLGQKDKNYPIALNLDYVISQNKTSGVEIGAMIVIDRDIYVAWKEGTNYGVDKIDWNNKYNGAYYKPLVIRGDRFKNKVFKDFVITYKSKPQGTDLTLDYYKNYGSSSESISLRDDADNNKMIGEKDIPAGALQPKITFKAEGNNAPEIENFYIGFEEETTL